MRTSSTPHTPQQEQVTAASDAEVGAVVFGDLAAANDALSSQLDHVATLPGAASYIRNIARQSCYTHITHASPLC